MRTAFYSLPMRFREMIKIHFLMILWEKFSDSCLEVSESMEVNGKRTFGYDDPIIYKRV